jgi:hypothetical protein
MKTKALAVILFGLSVSVGAIAQNSSTPAGTDQQNPQQSQAAPNTASEANRQAIEHKLISGRKMQGQKLKESQQQLKQQNATANQ